MGGLHKSPCTFSRAAKTKLRSSSRPVWRHFSTSILKYDGVLDVLESGGETGNRMRLISLELESKMREKGLCPQSRTGGAALYVLALDLLLVAVQLRGWPRTTRR